LRPQQDVKSPGRRAGAKGLWGKSRRISLDRILPLVRFLLLATLTRYVDFDADYAMPDKLS